MIKTSVIIPIYNTEKYLCQCIDSVLNQTQKEIEIILIDDGSTDGSGRIIDEYGKKYENIIAIHQENQKQGAARNKGLSLAKGEYIYFMDSDDYLENDALEQCYNYAKWANVDFIIFDAYVLWEDHLERNRETEARYNRSILGISSEVFTGIQYWDLYFEYGGIIECPQLYYIRNSFLAKNSLLFEPGIYYEDNDWTVRMFLNAQRMSYYPVRLYHRRYRAGSVIKSRYTVTHLNSALVEFWKVLEIHTGEIKKEKQQICMNMFLALIHLILKIIDEMRIEEIQLYLVAFVKELFEKDYIWLELQEQAYLRVLTIITMIKRKLQENGDVDKEIADKSYLYEKLLFDYVCENYKLQNPIHIGIYGLGKVCNDIFEWYKQNKVDIHADIELIVTEKSVETYRDYVVKSVAEIEDEIFDHIIVASTKYSVEMLDKLKERNISSKSVFVTPCYLITI